MAKKSVPPKEGNRIWIELEKPRDKADADKQCELANNMLKRLSDHPEKATEFWWSEHEKQYCLQFGDNGGYIVLTDRGHWFNLDYMGREL